MRSLVLACLASCASLPFAPLAAAQGDCEPPPDLLEPLAVTPTVDGRGVSLDAPIFVRFSEGYFEDPDLAVDPTTSILVRQGEDPDVGPLVPGTVQVRGDTLVFLADEVYAPQTRYTGRAFGITADLAFRFETGDGFDVLPPDTPILDEPSAERVDASCDAPDGGYRVDVRVRPSVDPDGPQGDIEYLLYLSRGPELDEPELRARVRNFATTDRIPMAFLLETEEAVSPVCVAVHVVDGVGNRNEQAPPRCFDPITGNFFEPLCSASPPGRDGGPAALALVGWLALGLVGARRRRRG